MSVAVGRSTIGVVEIHRQIELESVSASSMRGTVLLVDAKQRELVAGAGRARGGVSWRRRAAVRAGGHEGAEREKRQPAAHGFEDAR